MTRLADKRHCIKGRYHVFTTVGLLLLACVRTDAQSTAGEEDAPESEAEIAESIPVDGDIQSTDEEEPESKSGYADAVPVAGGSKSVGAELVSVDQKKNPIFDVDWTHRLLPRYYSTKERVVNHSGFAFSVDYSTLTQQASYSTTDRDAASSVFRIYGNWLAAGVVGKTTGSLVFKYEHRGAIFGRQTPRDLGFNTGSALSTANYKENGWGWTDLYWKQLFKGGKSIILIGHMDPGDWADQHSLLNAWTDLLNDAFYNNPTEAIPKRTFSLAGRVALPNNWYVAGGVHDANGLDNHIDFQQVWDTPELFTWVQVGFKPSDTSALGDSTHVHFWHQDAREQGGTEESWGVTFSSSKIFESGFTTVIRAGYSEGDAPQMRNFIGIAASWPTRGSDHLLLGTSWGSPPDKTRRSQVTSEIMYRLQLTQNMTISPNLQITINPSLNDVENIVYIIGLRARLTF